MAPSVRLARAEDLDGLMALAALTGGGMTNLPHDAAALAAKIEWSERSIASDISSPVDEFYLLVLAEQDGGRLLGTSSLYSCLGARWPFYSYKIGRVAHVSRDLGRSVSTQLLHLVNDLDGASEVGGLFLHPDARSGGLGELLARARYLFIAQHRDRFGERVIADLRGWTQDGISPFWEAVGKPFFGSDFLAADLHNAMHGNQFIADLMPRYPIYVSMLPSEAQAVIARPHPASLPARAMLEKEGFRHDGYIDIFDAGPTLQARTEDIFTVKASRCSGRSGERSVTGGGRSLSAIGWRQTFRAEIA